MVFSTETDFLDNILTNDGVRARIYTLQKNSLSQWWPPMAFNELEQVNHIDV